MPDPHGKRTVAILAVRESTASTLYGMYDILESAGRDWQRLEVDRIDDQHAAFRNVPTNALPTADPGLDGQPGCSREFSFPETRSTGWAVLMNRSTARLLLAALAALLGLAPAAAQEPSDSLPPLIDRALFFGNPQTTNSQLAPDGGQMAFIRPYQGTRNIWVKRVGESFDAARPVTADDRPVPNYFWGQDGERILYVQDTGGNENFHIHALDPGAEPAEDGGVPPARDLTPIDGVRATIYAVPEQRPGEIIVGLNDRDPSWHDVYRLDIATGERELLIENDARIASWVTDLEGNVRLAVRVDENGGTEILRVDDGELGETVYTCTVQETCNPVRFDADGERLYLTTNKGPERDLTHLVLFDPETGEVEPVESDPEGEVDFGGTVFSEETEELIATYYVGDRLRYYPKSAAFDEDLSLLQQQLPDGEIRFGSATENGRLQLVSVTRDVDPGSRYLYDRETGET